MTTAPKKPTRAASASLRGRAMGRPAHLHSSRSYTLSVAFEVAFPDSRTRFQHKIVTGLNYESATPSRCCDGRSGARDRRRSFSDPTSQAAEPGDVHVGCIVCYGEVGRRPLDRRDAAHE